MPISTLKDEFPSHEGTRQPESDQRASPMSPTRDFVVFFLVMVILALAANAFTLTTYPAIHTDEPWYANLAQNWLTTGNRWTTLDVGPFPDGRGQGTTLLGALPTRLAIQLGGLSLQAIRLPSLLAGIVLLSVVGAIGSLLWPGRSGPLAVLVLALQPLFLLTSHLARPEIWLALVALLALKCSLLGWKRNQPLWDVAAALLAVLSLDIHKNGAVFAIGLAATYVARYGRTVLQQRNSLAFIGTSLVGVSVYFYRNAESLLRLFSTQGSGGSALSSATSHSIPLLSGNPLYWLLNELARYAWYFGHDQMGALLLGFAIAAALRRRTEADRLLLVWLLGSAIGTMLLVSRRFELYLLPMVSVGILLVGRGMADLLQRPEPWGRRAMVFTLTVLMLPLLLIVGEGATGNAARLERELRESVPRERILGSNRYWLAFTGCDYRSLDVVNHYHHTYGFSLEESMAAIRPDYLIFDETIEAQLQEDFGTGGDMMDYYALPRADFERFLDDHTTLVRLLIIPGYGTIQIRQVHWRAES